jgi:hypothetical protein
MNTLEREGTAPFMRRRGSGPGDAPVYAFTAFESLFESPIMRTQPFRQGAVCAPVEFPTQWTVWGWEPWQSVKLVCMGATRATMSAPHILSFVTNPHSVRRSLPAELEGTYKDLDALEELEAGWNGHDVAAPKIEAIHDATEWIGQMYEEVSRSGFSWRRPHVAADENGDVTFEWWNGDKGLTVYVSADGSVSYLRDWGLDILDEMEDGPLSTPEQRHDIWAWFVQQ